MRLGKNINTENKKKVYRKPVVEVVEVDNIIVLGSTSEPDSPIETSSNHTSPDKPTYKEEQRYPRDNNPFGGGTPNFER